ncbi:class D sortase [Bacillus alkalicellulosilyticus]|uniref:class D sortase n=1 Tax=Alkalihalobacterium alkalicellulosilyticum TaxID=1912214 RepID=UPI0009983580|nr:class D sortase [Bacillus alkalicellulosilyticus]
MFNEDQRRIMKMVLLSLSALIVVSGLFFFVTNAVSFWRGYSAVSPIEEVEQVSKEETKPENEMTEVKYPSRPNIGDQIGVLQIPKLESEMPIFYGTNEDELERGVGHYAGSVLPGEKDNSVLSGHRDTVFRRLGEVGEGDLLIVTTAAGEFTYKVRKVRIVDKDDRTVIVPRPKATLTVSTCYPFNYVGAAPERYILIADLIAPESLVQ